MSELFVVLSFDLWRTKETDTFNANDVYVLYIVLCWGPYVAADVLYTRLYSVFGCSDTCWTESHGWQKLGWKGLLCPLASLFLRMSWWKVTEAWRKCSSSSISTLICAFSIPVSFSQWITDCLPPAHAPLLQGLNPSGFYSQLPLCHRWLLSGLIALWEILSC